MVFSTWGLSPPSPFLPPPSKLSTLYACHSAYFTVTIQMTQHHAYLCTFFECLCMFASQHVSKHQFCFCFHAGEFGVVYRAYLSGWEDLTSQVVAVKTLRGTWQSKREKGMPGKVTRGCCEIGKCHVYTKHSLKRTDNRLFLDRLQLNYCGSEFLHSFIC